MTNPNRFNPLLIVMAVLVLIAMPFKWLWSKLGPGPGQDMSGFDRMSQAQKDQIKKDISE